MTWINLIFLSGSLWANMIPAVGSSRDQNKSKTLMFRHDECRERQPFRHDEKITDQFQLPVFIFHHRCVSLISAITWLAFCNACAQYFETTRVKWLVKKRQSIGEYWRVKGGSVLPVACRQPPCAAGPCPLIQSADRWGGQIYTAGQQARSGGCPSHGWPGSASLPSARCGEKEMGEWENRPDRWLRTRTQDGLVIVLLPRWRSWMFDPPGGRVCRNM